MSMRKSTLIAAAVSLALAKHAAADSEQAANPASEELETVLVTGIRASLAESLEVKRQSQAVVDVITSEDVGKFPDKNVAEALQRVSGVSISREFGEGESAFRSAARTLTSIAPSCQWPSTATGADWFVLDQLSRPAALTT
jgi:iron complex outermembrane receptor protein